MSAENARARFPDRRGTTRQAVLDWGGQMVSQILRTTQEDINELMEIQQQNSPFNFSCNQVGKVWPAPGLGYTQLEDRAYVDFDLLNKIVRTVLQRDYRGKRSYLTREGAFLSDSDE